MTGSRTRPAILIAGLLLGLLAVTLQGVQGEELENVPSEDQCRPYIEKALKDLGTEGSHEHTSVEDADTVSKEDEGADEESAADANEYDEKSGSREKRDVSAEGKAEEEDDNDGEDDDGDGDEKSDGDNKDADQDQTETVEINSMEEEGDDKEAESAQAADEEGDHTADSKEEEGKSKAEGEDSQEKEDEEQADQDDDDDGDTGEDKTQEEEATVEANESEEKKDEAAAQEDNDTDDKDDSNEKDDGPTDDVESGEQKADETEEDKTQEEEEEVEGKSAEEESAAAAASAEDAEGDDTKEQEVDEESEQQAGSVEEGDADEQKEESKEEETTGESEEAKQEEESKEEDKKSIEEKVATEEVASVEQEPETAEASVEGKEEEEETKEDTKSQEEEDKEGDGEEEAEKSGEETEPESEGKSVEDKASAEEEDKDKVSVEGEEVEASKASAEGEDKASGEGEGEADEEGGSEEGDESRPEEEELIMEIEIPEVLRPRAHINQLLKLDEESEEKEKAIEKVADIVLRDLKRLYDNAIKPLETLYKYRDLSNRHFGDPEIFSKPLVLFMGPWSGGKSSIINYLMDIEYKPTALRTGAEPSPAYFNILMYGEEQEILDGTQLAADWTFSGLQKFGQGLLDRLKGFKLNNKLLEKVNIVEIPGILEIRKHVQRFFPFNDACQWFIDRADIIFLVYDPSKLDVGPETEAILDQLKGREYQTRIILNKADQVKPEELMRVQGALIWNISPLMSSAEPPIMYSTSLWSIPYEAGSPTRLLYAQERAFLRDLHSAIDKRVEHKIASARRFAVRVRNHAKMVDCYLTTYYNHKSFFAKKKDISDRIIENPQDYHIYEGLSTLTNISRYDLPDPDVYRDFFRLNPLYDFPLLSSTCTYFRGCPINRLDVAIAYDLPELVGKYKKSAEALRLEEDEVSATSAPSAEQPQQKQGQKSTAKSGASRMTMS